MAVTLRPANPEDEAFLYDLYASTRAEEVAAWGWSQAQQEMFFQLQFRAQSQHYKMAYPDAEHNIILIDERAAGRILIDRSDSSIVLVDISLLPEHRGKGVGTSLLKELLAEGERSAKPVRLHVHKANPARRLYERAGFSITADRDIYFQMEWSPAK